MEEPAWEGVWGGRDLLKMMVSPARGRKVSRLIWLAGLSRAASRTALLTVSKCLPMKREPSSLHHRRFAKGRNKLSNSRLLADLSQRAGIFILIYSFRAYKLAQP